MTALDRWKALPGWAQVASVLASVVLTVNVAAAVIDSATGGPGPRGPASSSYATSPSGVAAYATLLREAGHPVTQWRKDLGQAPQSFSAATIVILDAGGVPATTARRVARLVRGGATLVTADARGDRRLLEVLVADPPKWSPRPVITARPLLPVTETAGVDAVRTAGDGSWIGAGSALPVLGGPAGATALVARAGAGRAVLLAGSSPLWNNFLGRAANAAFALAIAGPQQRPVVFVESVHGYGAGTGLGALPSRWKWALAGLFAALLVFMAAHARRLGPAEDDARVLPPPRQAYVEAVAATLARSGDRRAAMAPARGAARRIVTRRSGIAPEAPDADVVRAAVGLGLDPVEAAAVVHGSDDPMVVGRALARATTGTRSGESR